MTSILERLEKGEEIDQILTSISPEELWKEITSNNFDLLLWACRTRLDVVNKLLDAVTDPVQKQAMIAAGNFHAFRVATVNGHVGVVNTILEAVTDPAQKQAMITAHGFHTFLIAAKNGHLGLVNKFLEAVTDPATKQTMIEASNFYAFRVAAENGHVGIVNKIVDAVTDPAQKQVMIAASNFYAFRVAVENGHLGVVNKLLDAVTDPVQKQAMIVSIQHLHLSQETRNIIDLSGFLNTSEIPNYKASKYSFVSEMMRQTYTGICEAFTGTNHGMSDEQSRIAEIITRRVGTYIYKNIKGIRGARNTSSMIGSPDSEELPITTLLAEELYVNIAKQLLPDFKRMVPRDLGMDSSEELLSALEKANEVAFKILKENHLEPSSVMLKPKVSSLQSQPTQFTELQSI
jgi:nucleoid DNA-binding protein